MATFTDDFTRGDGLVGSDWTVPSVLPADYTDPHDFVISGGGVVGLLDSANVGRIAVDRWVGSIAGSQYLDATFTFPGWGPASSDAPYLDFYMHLSDTAFTCVDAQLLQNSAGFRLRFLHWVNGAVLDTSYDYFHDWGDTAAGFKSTLGNAVSATSGTTLVITTTNPIAIGDLVVVRVATDNISTSAPTYTVTDSGANTYTVHHFISNGGTAAAGITGALIATKATAAVAAGGTITITLSGAVDAKAAYANSFTGFDNTLRSTPVGAQANAGVFGPSTTGTVNDGDLVIGWGGWESNNSTPSADTDTLNGSWSALTALVNAAGGTAQTRVQVAGQYKIVTAAGAQTWNTTGPAQDCVGGVVVFQRTPVNHTLTLRFEALDQGSSVIVRALLAGTPLTLGPGTTATFDTTGLGARAGMSSRFIPGSGGGGAIPRIESIGMGELPSGTIAVSYAPTTSAITSTQTISGGGIIHATYGPTTGSILAIQTVGALPSETYDWQPFVVRRTTGGDVLQQVTHAALHAALRYGARVVTPEEVAGTNLITRPYFYEGVLVTVQIPKTVIWSKAALVRGGFGVPTTPQDGIVVWYSTAVPQDSLGARIDLSQEVLDSPLTPPNWYYYSLFLWVGNQWVHAFQAEQLVPKDHGWGRLLFASIPPFYQRSDDEQAADGRTGPLRLFTNVLGYDLDYTQCWADGLLNVYNVDRAPMKLLQLLGSNMGFPYEQVLGGNRTRSVLEQLDDLNGLRGTQLGIERLVLAASDYHCDVQIGTNELLTVDDGDFHGDGGIPEINPLTLPPGEQMRWGIGHWEALNNITYLTALNDPYYTTQNAVAAGGLPGILARNITAGPGALLTPPGGRGAMVINAPGPESVIVCGRISVDVPGATLPGCMTTGVPVQPGGLYEFNLETIRTGWGATSQQPPQARVILGVLWFDVNGVLVNAVTGPAVPDNYDLASGWTHMLFQMIAPLNAFYACPVVWWRHASTWTGHATNPNVVPTFGRYVSMVHFGQVPIVGDAIAPVSPDVYLTLGVTSKKLSGAKSYLGEP